MRIAPGVVMTNNEWLGMPVETDFVQKPANIPLFVGQLDSTSVEEVTKDKTDVITPPPSVPVTSLDKAEAIEDTMKNEIATDEVPTIEKDDPTIINYDAANPYGSVSRPRGSTFNSRIAPPSIVPTTYPFGKPSKLKSATDKMTEGFKAFGKCSKRKKHMLGQVDKLIQIHHH